MGEVLVFVHYPAQHWGWVWEPAGPDIGKRKKMRLGPPPTPLAARSTAQAGSSPAQRPGTWRRPYYQQPISQSAYRRGTPTLRQVQSRRLTLPVGACGTLHWREGAKEPLNQADESMTLSWWRNQGRPAQAYQVRGGSFFHPSSVRACLPLRASAGRNGRMPGWQQRASDGRRKERRMDGMFQEEVQDVMFVVIHTPLAHGVRV